MGRHSAADVVVYEAWAANATLRLHEACTAPKGPELDVILRQVPYLEGIRGPETIRKEALESVRKQVRIRLERHSRKRSSPSPATTLPFSRK